LAKKTQQGTREALYPVTHDAAENASIMYSLPGCCAASDVNPREWLTDVLTRIPYYNSDYSLAWQIFCHIIGRQPANSQRLQLKSNNYWISLEKAELSNYFLKNFKELQQSCTGKYTAR
jgi:hypothetical protein